MSDVVTCVVYFLAHGEETICCAFCEAQALETVCIDELDGVPYPQECMCSYCQSWNRSEMDEIDTDEKCFMSNSACSTKYRSSSLSHALASMFPVMCLVLRNFNRGRFF